MEEKDLIHHDHDELMVKLMQREVWEKIIKKFLCENTETLVQIESVKAEVPVLSDQYNKKFIIGYTDIVVDASFNPMEWNSSRRTIYCEIKATEPSIGAVIRQIQKYNTFLTYPIWVVVSPYKNWEQPLLSQGIYWIDSVEVLDM